MTEWSLNPIFGNYSIVAMLIAGAALLLLVTPSFGGSLEIAGWL